MDFEQDFLKVKPTGIPLQDGVMLVAVPFFNDTFFNRSVVLLTDYASDGAAGLIVNRRTNVPIQEAKSDWRIDGKFFFGGPVKVEGIIALHTFSGSGKYNPVTEGVYSGIDDTLISMIEYNAIPTMKYRFYLGYSGWGEGQLDDEVERGMWVVTEYRRELLFSDHPSTVWETAVRHLGPDYRHWLDVPVNVSEN